MRTIQSALLSRLALFTSITFISALALTTNAGRALGPGAHAAHAAPNVAQTFTWSMAKRFGPKREGIVDYHWNEIDRNYEEKYVTPDSWQVDFDACVPAASATTKFALEINGVEVAKPASCKFSYDFNKQGIYIVRIKRTNAGRTTNLDGTVTIKDLLIVSLGDSFASGQGNPDIPKNGSTAARWVDAICARSSKAGPAQAAMQIEDADPHTSVTFLSYACTGAEIDAGILDKQERGSVKLEPQIKRLEKVLNKRPIDALIISAGGNDMGFSELVARCILVKNCNENHKTLSKFYSGLSRLDRRYKQLNKKINELLSVKKVFITEYPDLVRDSDGKLCDGRGLFYVLTNPLDGIKEEEAKWASENVITELNARVSDAAERWGWVYVTGVFNEFRKHGYCAQTVAEEKQRWVRTFSEAKQFQGTDRRCDITSVLDTENFVPALRECLISSGSVHPTEDGHKAFKRFLVQALQNAGVTALPGS